MPAWVRNAVPRVPAAEAVTTAERGADEGVQRTGVLVVLTHSDESVRHQEHTDGRKQEGERHGPACCRRRLLRIDVRGHTRRHQGDREADRLPD
jgi:hypothetical protein